jgi:hypothetical protein
MDQHFNDEPDNENKILDLTFNNQDDEGGEKGPAYICDHCEILMRKAEEDYYQARKS